MDTFLSKLQECGHTFEDVGNNRSIKLDELFKPERLSEIEQIVKKENWPVEINRSVWTVYDDQDYESAPLWALAFTDIWIDAVDFSSKCSVCGREHIKGDSDVQVPSVKSKRPILYVNGQFVIVDNVARDAIEAQLTGVHFLPFDEKGQYHYLLADIDLGSLVIKDDEVIGYSGDCPECGLPLFKTLFGPTRYDKHQWSGQDIVSESFHRQLLFIQKAFKVLKAIDSKTRRIALALLE